MWDNLKWLKAEWQYYFEWRKLAMAATLEGRGDLPKKNNPWGYTFRWLGVVVAFPLVTLSLVSIIGWAAAGSPEVLKILLYAGGIVLATGVIVWIIGSLVSMADTGPSYVVQSHWEKTRGKGAKSA